jgi:hypothetical protein
MVVVLVVVCCRSSSSLIRRVPQGHALAVRTPSWYAWCHDGTNIGHP